MIPAGELVDRDEEHLRLLSLAHYVAAAMTFIMGSFPLFHVFIGIILFASSFLAPEAPPARPGQPGPPPAAIGLMLAGMGGAFVLGGWSMAAMHFVVARSLRRRRRYLLCVIGSGVSVLLCMFGSGLVSVATLIVLARPRVRALFDAVAEAGGRPGGGSTSSAPGPGPSRPEHASRASSSTGAVPGGDEVRRHERPAVRGQQGPGGGAEDGNRAGEVTDSPAVGIARLTFDRSGERLL